MFVFGRGVPGEVEENTGVGTVCRETYTAGTREKRVRADLLLESAGKSEPEPSLGQKWHAGGHGVRRG